MLVVCTGVKIQMTPVMTFSRCLTLGLAAHAEAAVRVSEEAAKEFVIEQALDKMEAEWDQVFMDVSAYRNTG